jgi:hypothetical protein
LDGYCQPFQVEHGGPEVGRFLRATRDIRPFEVVSVTRLANISSFGKKYQKSLLT